MYIEEVVFNICDLEFSCDICATIIRLKSEVRIGYREQSKWGERTEHPPILVASPSSLTS